MHLKIIHSLKKFFSKTMVQNISILMVPMLFLLIVFPFNNSINRNEYESLLISTYTNELNSFLKTTEVNMTSIISSAEFICENADISLMLSTHEKPNSTGSVNAISSLGKAITLFDYIGSIAIYNRTADFVVTSQGLYQTDYYFNKLHYSEKYPLSFWKNSDVFSGNIKILEPISISSSTASYQSAIVPLVVKPMSHNQTDCLIIYNIDVNILFSKLSQYILTPNTKVYMIDNSTGNVYHNSMLSSPEALDYHSARNIRKSIQSDTSIATVNGEKCLLIKSTERSSAWGYTYLVSVPYSDINAASSKIFLISWIFLLVLLLFLIVFLFFGSKTLYLPWTRLAKIASGIDRDSSTEQSSVNISDYVAETMLRISEAHDHLKESFAITLPLSQEKYLVDILNDKFTGSEHENLLEPLAFKHDYFIALCISITLSRDYVIDKSYTTYENLQQQINTAISTFFSHQFITYELPSDDNSLYLLLNIENDSAEQIDTAIAQFQSLLRADSEYIDVYFGVGNIYEGVSGLKLTHHEAIMHMMKQRTNRKIQFSVVQNKNVFSQHSENILMNYLSSGLVDKAEDFLAGIFAQIIDDSPQERLQVYNNIIDNAINPVMRQKGIITQIPSFGIIHFENNPDFDSSAQETILELCSMIADHMKTNSKKIDINEVIAYINEHYCENIVLEDLAERYGTSAKYLSKRIRQYIDMPFKDYLTTLKINQAKKSLESDDITVAELYEQLGFQSRVAFTRAFKLKTGLAPSDYKKLHGGQNNKNT